MFGTVTKVVLKETDRLIETEKLTDGWTYTVLLVMETSIYREDL